MNDAEDDRHLHLVRVGKDEEVFRAVPGGVETEGVTVVGKHTNDGRLMVARRNVPSGVEQVQRLGEKVVVDEASIHGEDAHEQDDVATEEEDRRDLVEFLA